MEETEAQYHAVLASPRPSAHSNQPTSPPPITIDNGETSETLHESPPSSSHESSNSSSAPIITNKRAQARAHSMMNRFAARHRAKKTGKTVEDTAGGHAAPRQSTTQQNTAPSPATTPSHNLRDVVARATAPRPELRGKPRPLPAYFLRGGFHSNSYFAKRLSHVMAFIVVLDLAGILAYWLSGNINHGGLRVPDFSQSLVFQKKEACVPKSGAVSARLPSSASCDCATVVTYATLVFHMLPIVIMIGLPASGLRCFEPFKRELRSGGDHGKSKVKRSLYLQACELVSVVVVVLNAVVFVYFMYSFLEGNNFNCNETRVHFYEFGALISFVAIFMELTYFARFREHLKMQLGAFKEADQTGDIRARLISNSYRYRSERGREVSEIRKKLFKATELGNSREVSKLLAYARSRLGDDFADTMYTNASLFFKTFGHSKKNPLHVACYHGNIHLMDLLLRAGFKVNAYDKVSRVRFSTGDLFWYFAQFFIAKPPQTGEEDIVSVFKTTLVTPLFCAVSTGQIKAVKWLINRGADVNLHCKSSYSSERVPALFAAESPEIVALLMEAGANHLEVPDPGHMNTLTVLQLAYMRGNIPVARELEDWGGDVALTPLHTAAGNNHHVALTKLLHKGADPNTLGEHGYIGLNRRTPLHWAAINGAYDAVRVLLEAGADPNFQDVQGRTPLHWAARVGRVSVLRLLLEHNAEHAIRDNWYMTPMLCAALATHASKEIFEELVRAGANINDELPNGDTPLHIAMKKENRDSALTLLACGGDIMKTNIDGFRPVDCTTSSTLQFEVKRAAGNRDVMISYTHSHAEFAQKLRRSLEAANVTTWLDQMDPSGIGGGSVWREEIGRGILNAALVVCIFTEDYVDSEWCLKELGLAKERGIPIMAVSTERAPITDEMQVYVYTRQMVPFEPAITAIDNANKRNITYTYDDAKYTTQFRFLLDGVRDEVEKHRKKLIAKGNRRTKHSMRLHRSTFFYQGGDDGSNSSSDDGIIELDLSTIDEDFVFLCHGDQNRAFAQRIYDRLTEAGVFCFFDVAAPGQANEDMTERIHIAKEAMLKCACVIVIISSKTAASEIVRDQLAFAEDKGRPILPIMLNEVELTPDKLYSLSRTKLLHFTPELGFNASFNGLMETVREHVNSSSSADASVAGMGVPVIGGNAPQSSTRASLLNAAARAKALGRLKIKMTSSCESIGEAEADAV